MRKVHIPALVLLLAVAGLAGAVPARAQSVAERAAGHAQRGMQLKDARDYAAAAQEFRAALQLDSNHVPAHWGLAWTQISLGQEPEAVESFRWVIRLAPHGEEAVEAARAIERIRLRRPDLQIPAPEPETFLLALSVAEQDGACLYLADATGRLGRRLITPGYTDAQPRFCPTATCLIFVSNRAGSRDLWRINLDGSGLQRLTTDPADDHSPTWAHRRSGLVFVSERAGRPELWLLEPETGDLQTLGETSAGEMAPAWSPAGDLLAFVSDRDGPPKIFLHERSTGQTRKLLANTIAESRPVWSPDGRWLYFTWDLEGHAQICRVRPGGEGLEAVQPSPDSEELWGISPDERWLLVQSDRSGEPRLYLRSADGGQVRAVGEPGRRMLGAALSPALPQSLAQELLSAAR